MRVFERRKKKSSFPAFILILLLLIAAAFIVWNVFYAPSGMARKTGLEVPDKAIILVRLGASPNFIENRGVNELLEGEEVRVKKGVATLTFFDGTSAALDEGTQVALTRVRERESDRSVDIGLTVSEGRVWASVPKMINPQSAVILENSRFQAKIRHGEASFEQDRIAVAKGSVLVGVPGTSFESELELGQEITITDDDVASVKQGGSEPDKQLISLEFQKSPWFINNTVEIPPGTVATGSFLEESEDNPLEEQIPEEAENGSSDNEEGIILSEPGKAGETVEVAKDSVPIKGTVPANTQKVIVNNYTLQQFTPGNTEFVYNAAVKWGTLKKGRNEYKIVALIKDGSRIETEITLVYGESATDTQSDDEPKDAEGEAGDGGDEEPDSPSATTADEEESDEEEGVAVGSSSGLRITSPTNGDSVDDEIITIVGTAPANAAKIVVDGYTLTLFSAGDKEWNYRMSEAFGNRPLGTKVITVQAFGSDGRVIASDEIEFSINPAAETETDEDADEPDSTAESTSSATEESGRSTPANRVDERGVTLPPGYDGNEGSSI